MLTTMYDVHAIKYSNGRSAAPSARERGQMTKCGAVTIKHDTEARILLQYLLCKLLSLFINTMSSLPRNE